MNKELGKIRDKLDKINEIMLSKLEKADIKVFNDLINTLPTQIEF